MIEYIGKNFSLIICTFLTLFIIELLFHPDKLANINNLIKRYKSKRTVKDIFYAIIRLFVPKRGIVTKIFSFFTIGFFLITTFLVLEYFSLSIWLIVILFIPIAVILVIMFYVILAFTMIIIKKLVNCGSQKITILFSFCAFELFLLFISIYNNSEITNSNFSFILAFVNICVCYLLTLSGLIILMYDIVKKSTDLTVINIWKLVFLEFLFFLFELTMLSYIGWIHFPESYITQDGSYGMFAAFYHIIITFGTVGYGDIIPTMMFTRGVSILTVFTSIACITIMLSSVIPLTKNIKKTDDN